MHLLTSATLPELGDSCISSAGLVDQETASGGDVTLWTDASTVASIESATVAASSPHRASNAA